MFHGVVLACSRQIYVLCALYVMISLCVCSHVFVSSWVGGSIPCGGGWVCVVSSLSMASDIAGVCYALLFNLCILVLVLFGRVVTA